jgi:hypothetical protein
MRRRGFSLGTSLFAVSLVAGNLAAWRSLPWPALDFTPLHLAVGLVPLANVLGILAYRLLRHPETRGPRSWTLVTVGAIVMLGHACWAWKFPRQVESVCRFPAGLVFNLCQSLGVPSSVGVAPEGYSYFRHYPAVVLIKLGLFQLAVVGLISLIVLRAPWVVHGGWALSLRGTHGSR